MAPVVPKPRSATTCGPTLASSTTVDAPGHLSVCRARSGRTRSMSVSVVGRNICHKFGLRLAMSTTSLIVARFHAAQTKPLLKICTAFDANTISQRSRFGRLLAQPAIKTRKQTVNVAPDLVLREGMSPDIMRWGNTNSVLQDIKCAQPRPSTCSRTTTTVHICTQVMLPPPSSSRHPS